MHTRKCLTGIFPDRVLWWLYQEFFEKQLAKHSEAVDILEKNLTAQENILRALTETNAKYVHVRQSIEETERRYVRKARYMHVCDSVHERHGRVRICLHR